MAIVYVGNAVVDTTHTKNIIEKACRYTHVDKQKLYKQMNKCEYVDTADELMGIAEIIGDYIKMLYRTNTKEATKHHWLVSVLKQHAEQINSSTPTLRELAINYHKNEKYMGRLFKKEMGITFHQYCLSIRLQKAETLLSETSDKVIDIAFECGFNNISYFNRTFKAEYGVSPSTYAALKKK